MPALPRIQGSPREAAGAAELAGAELTAAAGARLRAGVGYLAQQGLQVGAFGSWGCNERGDALGGNGYELYPCWQHGR